MSDDGVRIEFDPKQFAVFMAEVKEFSPKLATALRRRLRDAGKETVEAIQHKLLEAAPGSASVSSAHPGRRKKAPSAQSRRRSSGLRGKLAAATKLTIVTGKSRQGIGITTSAAKLSPADKAMLRAWNKKKFRHGVFGDPNVVVNQPGNPFFGNTIRAHQQRITDSVQLALADAAAEMSKGR